MRIQIISYILILYSSLRLNSQYFTIDGIIWDTIYNTENILEFKNVDCNKLIWEVHPEAKTTLDGCTLRITPYHMDTMYKISVKSDKNIPIEIQLYSQRLTLKITGLANNIIQTEDTILSMQTTKQLRGVIPIINCPWLKNACSIRDYYFIIVKNGKILYEEHISGWELSKSAKVELQSVKSGTDVLFESIRKMCPGDCDLLLSDVRYRIK